MNRAVRRSPMFVNLLLLAATLAACILVAELVLRVRGPLHEIYAGHDTNPPLHEKYYKYSFPTTYRGAAWFQREFIAETTGPVVQNKYFPMSKYDPMLGWDLDPAAGRMRGTRHAEERTPDKGRIVCVGDSFIHGTDVEANESMPHYLAVDLKVETLNMGVGGYGIDQACLKYVYHGTRYKPDLVLLGIYPTDYFRATLPFSSFSKPVVAFDRGRAVLEVVNQPVIPPEEYFTQLSYSLRLTPYLIAAAESAYWNVVERDPGWDDKFFEASDPLIEHSIAMLQKKAREDGAEVLILDIPSSNAFVDPGRYDGGLEKKAQVHLLGIYERLQLAHVDIRAGFSERLSAERVAAEYYLPGRPGQVHLSAKGNEAMARIVADVLCGKRGPALRAPPFIDCTD